MAVQSASDIHIINVCLLKGSTSSKYFSKAVAVVQDVSATLSTIIWREALRASATMKYSNRDIKAAMAKDLDVCQLLKLAVSVFLDTTKCDNPHVICVVFDQTCTLITKKKDANAMLMAASRTSKVFLDSKFTVDAVAEFQVGYQNSRNKESFLKTYATESRGKQSIDEQIEAVVVHALLENGLRYKY